MDIKQTSIPGLLIIEPKVFSDARGYFMETYRQDVIQNAVGPINFIQDNESESQFGVLRGLHLQTGEAAQAKLVRVVSGKVFDVAVDLRNGSPTFGKWFGTVLSHENKKMIFIPRGFAHGFLVLSPTARFAYKVDNFYSPQSEITINYRDESLSIDWPELDIPYILSEKDVTRSIGMDQYRAKFVKN